MQKDIQQSQARELNQILLSRLLIHVLEGVSDKLFSREYGKKFAQDVRAVMATRELDVYKVSEYLDNALNQLPRVDFEATVAGYMGKTEEDRDRIAALVEKMYVPLPDQQETEH